MKSKKSFEELILELSLYLKQNNVEPSKVRITVPQDLLDMIVSNISCRKESGVKMMKLFDIKVLGE